MNTPASFLEDNAGGLSSTRLAFLLWAIGVLAIWIHACLVSKDGNLVELPTSIQTILGILMSGKVVQRFGEKPDAPAGNVAGGGGAAGKPGGGGAAGAAGGGAVN